MNTNKKLKSFLIFLETLEYIYLAASLFIVFAQKFPSDSIQSLLGYWITTSFMILPVLFFKNILVSIMNNGALTSNEKTLTLVRCALYLALTIYAYPLILQS